MRGSWVQRAVVVALTAAVVAGPLGGEWAWAGKKSKMKATVAGAKFKVNRKPGATAAGGSYEPVTGMLNIVGGSGKLRGRGLNTTAEVKLLTITTQVSGLESATFPLSVPVELTTFSRIVTQGVGTPATELWTGEGVTLTIQSYENGRIKATFDGVIPASEGTTEDAAVEGGKLNVLLNAPAV
jgi:hypothetical protein